MEKLPTFKGFVSDDETGVGLVSFVSAPAIEKGWMAFNKQQPSKLHLGDRQVVTGPVLIPDKLIFRLQTVPGTDQVGPFNIYFDAQQIETIASRFMKNGFTTKTNLEHEISIDSNHVIESWIVTDPACDKSKALGFEDVVTGTWFMSYKVNDSALWENEIKTGKRTGFSIEGFFDFEKVELKKVNTTFMDFPFLKKIQAALSQRKPKIKLGEAVLADGKKIVWDDETMLVYWAKEDGTQGDALPDGDYSLADGSSIKVTAGKIEAAKADPPKPDEVAMHSIVLRDGKIISINPTSLEAFLLDIGETAITKKPLQDGEYCTMDYYNLIIAGGKFSKQHSSYPYIMEAPAETVTDPTAQLTQTLYSVFEKAEEFRENLEATEAKLKAATDDLTKANARLAAMPGGKPIVTTPSAEDVTIVHESRSEQVLSEVDEMAARLREKAKKANSKPTK